MAWLVLEHGGMANTTFIAQNKGGIRPAAPSSAHQPEEKHSSLVDGLLLVGFLAAFVGLVLLLAK